MFRGILQKWPLVAFDVHIMLSLFTPSGGLVLVWRHIANHGTEKGISWQSRGKECVTCPSAMVKKPGTKFHFRSTPGVTPFTVSGVVLALPLMRTAFGPWCSE
ncbi:hypothetical protein KIL84_015482 [Mauremys mutica]|uniref:Uncharacterized protein n=1 Tax=Mauremys mutica TaxID=74926 RepID=A0A9D3WSI7_9SAUR|nr:hypothetical protein KIL84_015482 [Mauremys mutica]